MHMRILVTGSSGRVGRPTVASLTRLGHEVVGFDADRGDSVLDVDGLTAAARGVDAVVHCAGLPDDDADWEQGPRTLPVNLVGTWNVLYVARNLGIGRVVHLSSGKALGLLERDPDYLPVDDDHRGLPAQPYALSKWLAEEACEAFTREWGITTICLRPVLVLDPTRYPDLAAGSELPAVPGAPWHLAVWIDVDDVAEAIVAATVGTFEGHTRLLLCADDIGSDRPTADLLGEHLPAVPWRGAPLDPGSRRALVDSARARELLGWSPRWTWVDRAERTAPSEPAAVATGSGT